MNLVRNYQNHKQNEDLTSSPVLGATPNQNLVCLLWRKSPGIRFLPIESERGLKMIVKPYNQKIFRDYISISDRRDGNQHGLHIPQPSASSSHHFFPERASVSADSQGVAKREACGALSDLPTSIVDFWNWLDLLLCAVSEGGAYFRIALTNLHIWHIMLQIL